VAGRIHWTIGLISLALCIALDVWYFPPGLVFPDETRFLSSALHLVATGDFASGGGRAWEMPGTAIYIAAFAMVFGKNAVLAVRISQGVLLLIQCFLIKGIADRLFRPPAGIIAFALVAFYPFFMFYQGLLLSETLFDTLLVASFAALFWWVERGSRIDVSLFIGCVLFSLTAYVKPTLTILPPLLLALAARHVDYKHRAKVLIVSAVAYAALLAPWTIRNYYLLDSFVPFTTSASENLYLGNNAHNLAGGIDWSRDVDGNEVAKIRAMPSEVDRQKAFGAKALSYIVDEPFRFLKTAGLKFIRFWNVVPNAAEYSGLFYAIVSALSFGPILFFAILSVALMKDRRKAVPIYLLIGYLTFVHTVTIASLRYRLPLEPFLIVLASWSVSRAWCHFEAWRGARLQSRPT
jgi:4-amino-4-deoxy-L-arabinose transferase-like glycosyltransferase